MATGTFSLKDGPLYGGSVGGTKPVVVGVFGSEVGGCSGCGVDVGTGSVVNLALVVSATVVVGSVGAVVLSAGPSGYLPSGSGFSLDNI